MGRGWCRCRRGGSGAASGRSEGGVSHLVPAYDLNPNLDHDPNHACMVAPVVGSIDELLCPILFTLLILDWDRKGSN